MLTEADMALLAPLKNTKAFETGQVKDVVMSIDCFLFKLYNAFYYKTPKLLI